MQVYPGQQPASSYINDVIDNVGALFSSLVLACGRPLRHTGISLNADKCGQGVQNRSFSASTPYG